MHAKYEVSTSNGSKVIANVKVDNRQTNRQTNTNRQDKNNMPPIIRSGGHKNRWEKKHTSMMPTFWSVGIKINPSEVSFSTLFPRFSSIHIFYKMVDAFYQNERRFRNISIQSNNTCTTTPSTPGISAIIHFGISQLNTLCYRYKI